MDALPPPSPAVVSIRTDQCVGVVNGAGSIDQLCMLGISGEQADLAALYKTLRTERWQMFSGGPPEKKRLTIIVAGQPSDKVNNLLKRFFDGAFGPVTAVHYNGAKAGSK